MKKLLLIPAFLALVLTTGCPKGGPAKLATASDVIAHSLDAAQQAEQTGLAAGVVSPAENAPFQAALSKTAQAGVQLDAAILAQANSATVSAKASAFIDSFNALVQSGLVFKNPNVQLGIETALNGAQLSLVTIEGLVIK